MPSTVREVFADAALTPMGVVAWNAAVPVERAGVYVVALTADPDERGGVPSAPVSLGVMRELLAARPELLLDGRRPLPEQLNARIEAFWLPDETILYIGLAGTSLRHRVNAYYRTPFGARSPHAGGWFLKALSNLDALHVHYALCDNPAAAEKAMLAGFSSRVSSYGRHTLHDPDRSIPFANLEWPKGRHKRHGITGAKASRTRAAGTSQSPSSGSVAAAARAGTTEGALPPTPAQGVSTQRVTEADRRSGRIRFPNAAKHVFPVAVADVEVDVRGTVLRCRWDPRKGPDKERSGVLAVGKDVMQRLVRAEERLTVTRDGDRILLR